MHFGGSADLGCVQLKQPLQGCTHISTRRRCQLLRQTVLDGHGKPTSCRMLLVLMLTPLLHLGSSIGAPAADRVTETAN